MLKEQAGFRAPAISPDRLTAGWFVEYPYPAPPEGTSMAPITGALALYRSGRIIHVFETEPVGWDWQFQDGGKRVAYSTGPTHGGATECFLRDVDSGKLVAAWLVRSGEKTPEWALTLRL